MTMLNTEVHIQTKNGQDVGGWPASLGAFWAPTGGTGFFDPRIIYDSLTGSWMATVLSGLRQPSSAIHLAIHPGPDPSVGSWSFFTFPADPMNVDWADFPDIGCSVNWVALTVDMYSISSDTYSGAAMWAIERPIPLSGPAVAHVFPAEFDKVDGLSGISLRPCLTFDEIDTLYIVDSSGYIDDDTEVAMLRLSRLTGPIDGPVWSVQPSGNGQSDGLFTVPESNDFDYEPPDASQLGTSARIETNYGDMLDAVFRNGHVWCTHAGGFPDSAPWWLSRCAAFWYELDPSQMPEPILQAGVIDGGTDVHHYYPSLAVDAFDNMCIGFTRSHSGIYAQGAFAGRLSAMAPGTVGPVQVLKLGVAPYIKSFGNSGIRWGDYSATVIDPVTDTFWVLQEYAETPSGPTTRWGTWWGEVDLDTAQVGVEDADPTLSRLFPAPYPNPFISTVVFVVNLEREADVRIDIFDLTGRKVRGLVAGRYSPGIHELTWRGRDNQGRGLAGGVYFARLSSEEETIVHKIYKSSPIAPF
jgi:hypothetical protein